MDLSGIIFVVLAVAWAVYLVPKALKHHDEVVSTRSVDRFSNAMRVLARREPVNRRDTRLVVTPPRPEGPRMVVPSTPPARPSAGRRDRGAERAAARAATRRRRHILLLLLFVDAAVVAVSAAGVAAWWSVAVPVVLTLLYLYLCRTQVRRQADAVWAADEAAEDAAVAPRRAIRVDAPYGAPRQPVDTDEEETVTLSAAALRAAVAAGSLADAEAAAVAADQQQVVAVSTADGDSLWDPLPVTLPTYVGKARAARTVRTIDLGSPGAWTSGRTEEDSRLVEEAAAESASAEADAPPEQRAVGS